MRSSVRAFLAFGFASLAVPCAAQCREWQVNVGQSGLVSASINALAVYDEGAGKRLFAGGKFDIAGSRFLVARWDGASWVGIDNFTGSSVNGHVQSLCVFDDGIQPVLVASGKFVTSGATPSRYIAAWDGTTWKGLGTGLDGVAWAMCTFDDGTGPALYAAGHFIDAGAANAFRIAKWDGTTWSYLGSPAATGMVYALCVFDAGTGPALYAGGGFQSIGGIAANRVARFDGSSWSAVGTNLDNGPVKCLTVHNAGTGPALYAGGLVEVLDGAGGKGVAKWNGATWKPVGYGAHGGISTLASWNDGSGAKLVAGGGFLAAGGAYASHVAAWDGTKWKRLRTGIRTAPPYLAADVYAALPFDEGLGHGTELFVAGHFSSADGAATHSIARYGPCTPVGQTFCFGDGSLPTPCPCAPPDTVPHPSGGSDGGCANSFVTSGAKLSASGTTNPDTARLLVSDVFTNEFGLTEFGLFVSGNASDAAGVASGDGVRCAGGTFVRFGSQNGTHGFFRYPNDSAGWSLPLSQASSVTPGSGVVRHYQLLYRNPAPGFCTPETFNWTNAVTLIW
jgi:hypothetical protein